MDKADALTRLKRSERALRGLGIQRLSLFGSTARGQQRQDSDVDLAATLDPEARIGLFRYAEIVEEIERMLGAQVDLVTEPSRNPRLQAQIDRDRIVVF